MKEIKEKLFNDYVTMNGGDIISAEVEEEPEQEPEQGTVLYANSCSYNDVIAAINQANVGDTIIVPDGEATWSQALIITKGVILKAATPGGVTITNNTTPNSEWGYDTPSNHVIAYTPQDAITGQPFRLSGFILDAGGVRWPFLGKTASATLVINQFRIDHCTFQNSKNASYNFYGEIYGVIDNNTFYGVGRHFSFNETAWNNFTFDYGTANNLYLEDNTIHQLTTSCPEGGLGGRYCYRYNTFDYQRETGLQSWFDMHGNGGTGGNHGTMGAEIYGNTVDCNNKTVQMFDQRGGKLIAFNNSASDASSGLPGKVREEYNDALNPPATNPSGQPQHVSDSYYWNQSVNDSVSYSYDIPQTLDYGETEGIVPRWDVHCFKHVESFDGSSGVGVGTLAERPETCTTEGVAWWATDENKLYVWHNGE